MWNRSPGTTGLMVRMITWTLLLGNAPLMAGCNIAKGLFIMTAPTTEKVPAEFNRLDDRTVLVHVWAPREIQWDYTKVRLDLAAHLCEYLRKNVPNINLVDYFQVESYLEKHNQLQADAVQVGRHFDADMVVHLSVHHLSMRDPGMSHFYRGRLAASVIVHDLSQPNQEPEAVPLGDVEVAVPDPDKNAIGFTNITPAEVRRKTYETFIEKTGRKFHAYERAVD